MHDHADFHDPHYIRFAETREPYGTDLSEGNDFPQEPVGYPDPGVHRESGGYPNHPDAYPESGPYQEHGFDPVLDTVSLEEGLAQLLRASAPDGAPAVPPPPMAVPRPRSRNRRKPKEPRWRAGTWVRVCSLLLSALTAAAVTVISALGASVSYHPLEDMALTVAPPGLARWWPLLVFGPWLVATFSILRSALHRRRITHPWLILLLFSSVAVTLCVSAAPKTLPGIAVAALPPISACACLYQFIRQIALTRFPEPRHTSTPRSAPRRPVAKK
ncbi:DUF2637 domain-containing protein [Streptomyces lushanensis]|uniref:DUF2637 domain-containing protein n=1 Tax=Streptomyces lushanensis TaxID=1434255 RepID=UPI00099FD397|nr:DUF2637 domain-containing protein [Streptomyces lushanensis]